MGTRKKIYYSMKNIILLLSTCLLAASCSSSYYQICKTQSDNVTLKEEGMVYEDSNCKITYNLWCEGGNAGFMLQNKTDQALYLDLAESFYVKNGIAYDYFLNREFSHSATNATSVSNSATIQGGIQNGRNAQIYTTSFGNIFAKTIGLTASNKKSASLSNSISYREKAIIVIPSGTSKYVTEYAINKEIYRDCDYLLFPNKKQTRSMTFNQSNSPVRFSNTVAYRIGEKGSVQRINNNFYVDAIENISGKLELKKNKGKDCNGKKIKGSYMKDCSTNSFYIGYTDTDFFDKKH